METITQLKNIIALLNSKISELAPHAYEGDKHARILIKAYDERISAIRITIMELEGLGETNMMNLIEKQS